MIKLPSLVYVTQHAAQTFRRFPYVLISAVLSAIFAVVLTENNFDDPVLTHIWMTCALGIPFFLAITLYLEKPFRTFKLPSYVFLLGGLLFLVAFYFISGSDLDKSFYLHYAQWSLVMHLAVAFVAFFGPGEINGFWQFNRSLFMRFVLSSIYSAVFFFGLALALSSLDFLLGIKLHDELYGDLWFFTVFMILTWHFLAGIPQNLKRLEDQTDYPGALKIFTQYLLIPLVCLYSLILYIYMGKIVVQWHWPKGMVTWLVSGLSVFGVFTLLLVYPVENRKGNEWIKAYARYFYLGLFPLLIMLFIAAFKRVEEYSITEERYFVLVLAFWILGVVLYFLNSRKRNIKWIPLSLCLLALATSFGPWGAYDVSKNCQLSRLKICLVKNQMWDGLKAKALAKGQVVSSEDEKQMSSILDYLIENHGVGAVKGWFTVDLSAYNDNDRSYSRYDAQNPASKIMASLGLQYVSPWQNGNDVTSHFNYYRQSNERIFTSITGYDYISPQLSFGSYSQPIQLGSQPCSIEQDGPNLVLKEKGTEILSFNLNPLVSQARKLAPSVPAPQEPAESQTLTVTAESPAWSGVFYLESMNGDIKDKAVSITNGSGFILLKKK